MGDKLFTLLGTVLILAIVTTVIINYKGSSSVITSGGNAFTNFIQAATQQKVTK